MATCRDIATFGVVALDDVLPPEVAGDLADHLRECRACSAYLAQSASTSGIVAMRHSASEEVGRVTDADAADTADQRGTARTQRLLLALARAADPLHADDLVQDTWQHLLEVSPDTVPTRTELSDHLLDHLRRHRHDDEALEAEWADVLLRTYRHHPTAMGEADSRLISSRMTDNSRGPEAHEWLEPDADHADLFHPEFYDDGPDADTWINPPTAWPTITRILSPDAELETADLYRAVDSALEELPPSVGDAVYLVDLQGHSIETASFLLGANREDARAALSIGRNHLRGRIDNYLSSH